MKKLLLCLMLLLLPVGLSAMPSGKKDFWFCAQMGAINNQKIFVASQIHKNMADWDNNEKADRFEKIAQKQTHGLFTEQYEAYCIHYEKREQAEVYLQKTFKKARDLGFDIVIINLQKEKQNE